MQPSRGCIVKNRHARANSAEECAEESEAFGGKPRRLRSNRAHERSEVAARSRADAPERKGPDRDADAAEANLAIGEKCAAESEAFGGKPRRLRSNRAHERSEVAARSRLRDASETALSARSERLGRNHAHVRGKRRAIVMSGKLGNLHPSTAFSYMV